MSNVAVRKVCCSTCKLEAELHAVADRPYTVTFDSAQFSQKCTASSRTRSYSCVELDLAIAVVTGRCLPTER
jgi:hypothetical protein